MNIRFATIEDLPRLAELNSFGTAEGKKMAEERLPAFIQAGNCVVVETEGEIIGLLYWKREFFGDENWLLTQVTVDENHRRQGIGENLWRWLLEYAKKQAARAVFADIAKENEASTNLARKLGGKEVGSIHLSAGDTRNFWRFDLLHAKV